MIDPNKKEHAPVQASSVCYRAFELIRHQQYADAEKLLVGNMAKTEDDTAIALYHSTLGVLFKLQGEYKTAWKHYQRAEKLLPKDPALKLISARLLLEEFTEYDQAIRKAKQVFELIPDNPVFAHQAYSTIGLAHLKRGEKRKAISALQKSATSRFRGFITAKNIDFSLVEAMLRRGWGVPECGEFLEYALQFAKGSGEEKYIELFRKMLNAYQEEYGA